MAGVVAALARLVQPALAVPGGEPGCRGLAPWYLLLGLRMVALFIADGPWSSARPDLACNWTTVEVDNRPFCGTLCFNQHFSTPVSSAWGFAFLVALLPVGLMRLIRAESKHQRNAADEEQANPASAGRNVAAGFNMAGQPNAAEESVYRNMAAPSTSTAPSEPKAPFHCTWRAVAFGGCVILLLAMELSFLWVVTSLQIPAVSERTFVCFLGSQTCPEPLECTLAGQADKRMALWTLAFTAFVNMAACLAYLLLKLGKVSRCPGR